VIQGGTTWLLWVGQNLGKWLFCWLDKKFRFCAVCLFALFVSICANC